MLVLLRRQDGRWASLTDVMPTRACYFPAADFGRHISADDRRFRPADITSLQPRLLYFACRLGARRAACHSLIGRIKMALAGASLPAQSFLPGIIAAAASLTLILLARCVQRQQESKMLAARRAGQGRRRALLKVISMPSFADIVVDFIRPWALASRLS